MLLVAPRVNIAPSHVVRRDVRAPNKIGVCQNDHRLTSVWWLGGLYERILEERVSFNMPHAVSRLHSVLELGQHSPGAARAVKIAMTQRRPMADNARMQARRSHLRRHRMFDDFCINALHFLEVSTAETLT